MLDFLSVMLACLGKVVLITLLTLAFFVLIYAIVIVYREIKEEQ